MAREKHIFAAPPLATGRAVRRRLALALALALVAGSLVPVGQLGARPANPSLRGSGAATERPRAALIEEAAPSTPDALDCAALRIDTTRLQHVLVRPGTLDLNRVMAEAFPDGPPLERIKKVLEADPAGLCHYRDANRSLPPESPGRVVFLGDSITEAWQLASPELFAGNTIDRGISGQTSSQMLLRFRQDVLALRPRVVHIMAGINDINTPAGTILTRSNIESMVDLAETHGIRVILASITPCDRYWFASLNPAPQIREMNGWLRAFARRRGLAFVDYHAVLVDARGGLRTELTNDALHPNARGYALMTPLAAAAVAALSRTPVSPPQ